MPKRLVAEPVGVPRGGRAPEVLLMGASAGGPPALERILSQLPFDFPLPVVICQHMPLGFTRAWAERLDDICSLRVGEARSGQILTSRTVYIAPIGTQLRFSVQRTRTSIVLFSDLVDSLHVPSIDVMFSSAADVFGSRSLAVLLTGLGHDGAQGLLDIHRAGGWTIVESPETAVSYSMPGAAVALGAAQEEAGIDEMAQLIRKRASGDS
ncbi:MAG: CheB methylesterase domain-containing protein [Coriobacteriia bacterium]